MPASAPPYIKLRGTGTQVLMRIRLYLGPDHLLQVTSSGFHETYRRFLFGDIQAVSWHKTVTGMVWNLVCIALLVMLASLAYATGWNAMPLWLALGAIVLGFLVGNTVVGPTCACYIQTAVQMQRLHSITRVRRARALLTRLRPHINASAGGSTAAQPVPNPEAPVGS